MSGSEATEPGAQTREPTLESELLHLRAEIERTRAELGATVEALSQKADVKAQARNRIDHAKGQALERAHETRRQAKRMPVIPLSVGAGLVALAVWRIRRR